MRLSITEVRIHLHNMHWPDNAFRGIANIVLAGAFVIRRCKVMHIGGRDTLQMPFYETLTPCPICGHDNPLRHTACKRCRNHLPLEEERAQCGQNERPNRRTEVCHPVASDFRHRLITVVHAAYNAAVEQEIPKALVRINPENDEVESVEAITRSNEFDEFITRKPKAKTA